MLGVCVHMGTKQELRNCFLFFYFFLQWKRSWNIFFFNSCSSLLRTAPPTTPRSPLTGIGYHPARRNGNLLPLKPPLLCSGLANVFFSYFLVNNGARTLPRAGPAPVESHVGLPEKQCLKILLNSCVHVENKRVKHGRKSILHVGHGAC